MFIILLNDSFSDIFVFFTHHIFIDTVVSIKCFTNTLKTFKERQSMIFKVVN